MPGSISVSTTRRRPPFARVRRFFELTQQKYKEDGYLGCLMGGLGQELSGVSDVFRRKIEWCFSSIAERMATCLEEARQNGEIPADATCSRWRTFWSTAGRAPRCEADCVATRRR